MADNVRRLEGETAPPTLPSLSDPAGGGGAWRLGGEPVALPSLLDPAGGGEPAAAAGSNGQRG
uniref:Uncharacterized protein n=1 Tax=Oryza sativa subsp. japonica TaxID=39947 RepID=Q6YSZ3_ORYSJ|nr:hypothetical protein [Oryza sativa Japonica Group]